MSRLPGKLRVLVKSAPTYRFIGWALVVLFSGTALFFGIQAVLPLFSREIRIGAVLPLTGTRSSFGLAIKRGIEMAVEDVNTRRTLHKKLVCRFGDDRSDPAFAAEATRRLIEKEGVIALIGSYSNLCTLAACDVTEKKRVPLISPVSSGEAISTRGYRWVFRLNGPTSHYALVLMDFLTSQARAYRIGLLYETDNAGTEFATCVKNYVKEMNCTLVNTQSFVNNTPDLVSMLEELKQKKVEAILVSAHLEDALHMMKDARKLKLHDRPFAAMGSGFSLPEFIQRGTGSVEHTFSAVHWNADVNWPGARDFAKRFKARCNVPPDEHSAAPYAAVQVLAACFADRAAQNRNGLRKALLQVDVNTIYGHVKFEDYEIFTNQNSHYPLVQQVQKGRYVIVWPGNLRHAPPVFDKP
jgi:branched-chain amino acid transport system substrate-binding protein